MTASAVASAFETCGGSASGGSCDITREMRSRTSLVAASMSRSTSNSMRMLERSSSLSDSSFRIPSMPAIRSSMAWVILFSTTAAEAPR